MYDKKPSLAEHSGSLPPITFATNPGSPKANSLLLGTHMKQRHFSQLEECVTSSFTALDSIWGALADPPALSSQHT